MGNYTRAGYHSANRGVSSWRGQDHRPLGQRVGIELELEHARGFGRLLELLPDTGGIRPHTERDGSLSDRGGLEIIFPPYSYQGIRRSNSYFRKALAALATDPPLFTGKTGMHMNINTTGWSTNKQKLFVFFLHNIPPAVLQELGGRPLNNYCQRLYIRWVRMDTAKKHDLAWIRNNRIEVRFSKATLDMNRVSTLITLFELVEEFVTHKTVEYFNRLQRTVRYTTEDEWYLNRVVPDGQIDMSRILWITFKEFVNAKPKTKNIKAFLAAAG